MTSTRLFIGAAGLLVLAGAATVPVLAASGRATTLHVEVREKDSDSAKMRAEMPLSVAGAMAAAFDQDALRSAEHLDALSAHGFDLKKFWEQVRESDIQEFFTLEAEDATIRGWREKGLLRVSIHTRGHQVGADADDEDDDEDSEGPQTIELRLPESILEMLFDDSGKLTPEAFVNSLERLGPMTLVEISGGDENVRVWID
jgi:hypothetical protein